MIINRLFNFMGHLVPVHIPGRRFVRMLLVGLIALFVVFAPQTALAGQTVDPSTLNPPPPPEFNPYCYATGNGTICDISFTQVDAPGGTGLICGTGASGYEVIGFDTRTVNGYRVYDQNGNLVLRHFREDIEGTLTNPLTGTSVKSIQIDTIIHTLSVPGDFNSGTFSDSGLWKIYSSSGTVLVDAGRAIFLEATGNTLWESANHPFSAYYEQGDTSAIQPICSALQ